MSDDPKFLDLKSEEEAEAVSEPAIEVVPGEERPNPTVTFFGNSYDLTAVVAVTIGGVVLLTCATCNMGYYCLPFVPLILGIVGLVAAKDAVDPDRTKLLSWISVGIGGAIFLLIILAMMAYFALFFSMFALEGMEGF